MNLKFRHFPLGARSLSRSIDEIKTSAPREMRHQLSTFVIIKWYHLKSARVNIFVVFVFLSSDNHNVLISI